MLTTLLAFQDEELESSINVVASSCYKNEPIATHGPDTMFSFFHEIECGIVTEKFDSAEPLQRQAVHYNSMGGTNEKDRKYVSGVDGLCPYAFRRGLFC